MSKEIKTRPLTPAEQKYTYAQSMQLEGQTGTIGSTELVIGHNPNAPNPYVCWYCKGGSNYFWGYYTNELDDARKKLNERYQSECRMPYNQPAQKQKNGDYRER